MTKTRIVVLVPPLEHSMALPNSLVQLAFNRSLTDSEIVEIEKIMTKFVETLNTGE